VGDVIIIGLKNITEKDMEEAAERILDLEVILEDYNQKAQVLAYKIQNTTDIYVKTAKRTAQRTGAWLYLRQETENPFRIYPDIEYTVAREPIITRGALDQDTSIKLTSLKDAYNKKMWVLSVRASEFNDNMEDTYQDILMQTTADVRFTERKNGRYIFYSVDPEGERSMFAKYDLKNGLTVIQTEEAQLLSFDKVNRLNQEAEHYDSDLCILVNQSKFAKCEDMLRYAAAEVKNIYSTLVRNDGMPIWAPVGSTHIYRLLDRHPLLKTDIICRS